MLETEGTDELIPPEINAFEYRWLGALAVSIAIAVLMFDYSASMIGVKPALAINAVLFVAAVALMFAISRRRSNVARWLLAIPFNLLILFYDVSHFAVMQGTWGADYLAPMRLGLMAWATWALFTPAAAAWLTHRPDPDLELD